MLWLAAICGGGTVAPPINMQVRTVVPSQRGGVAYIWIVYTRQGSVGVTAPDSLVLLDCGVCSFVLKL